MSDLPQNIEAEKSALGSVLISPSKWALLAAALTADSFFLPAHREIFEAMSLVAGNKQPMDEVSIGEALRTRSGTRLVPMLLDLAGDVPSSENAGQYVAIVAECHRKRQVIALCAEVASQAHGDAPSAEIIAAMGAGASRLATRSSASLLRAGELVPGLLEEFAARAKARQDGGSGIDGVRLGVADFDEVTLGLRAGNLSVIAADPGGGKTAAASQCAYTCTLEDDGTALIFNLEMTRRELVERAFSRQARVNSHRLRRGDIDYEGFKALHKAACGLIEASLYVEDSLFSLAEIVARAREWRARHPAQRGLLVVDYLQLMRSTNDRDSRAREIGRWCGTLKELAKELAVHVMLVSQLNRAAAQAGQRPTMRNLRDSGEIEQAADVIVLLYNEAQADDGVITAIVEKNRHGPLRSVPLRWTARYYEFGATEVRI